MTVRQESTPVIQVARRFALPDRSQLTAQEKLSNYYRANNKEGGGQDIEQVVKSTGHFHASFPRASGHESVSPGSQTTSLETYPERQTENAVPGLKDIWKFPIEFLGDQKGHILIEFNSDSQSKPQCLR